MPVRRGNPPLLIALDRDSGQPLIRQLYLSIRASILSGRLGAGARLPATRTLATDLGVSRTTVVLAYEQLLAEGFVSGRGSAGTIVSNLVLPRVAPKMRTTMPVRPPSAAPVTLPTLGLASPAPWLASTHAASRPFRVGEPALDLFPVRLWTRLCSKRRRASTGGLLAYGDAGGYPPLRRAIAEYTAASRGVRASPEQIVLVRGAQQAVDLVARILLDAGDRIWFEDPGYPMARQLFELSRAIPVPIPLDDAGLRVEVGLQRAPDARLAYVAPSHQFPLGRTMSLERRLALLAWASSAGAWIVEDDYDSEFRYPGPPIASLQGLDRADRVIYVGTFSKTVFPALRLGYLILPPELVERFVSMRTAIDHMAPSLEQAALADFIDGGHFTRHLRRMRAAYLERQEELLELARQYLAGLMRVEPADSGMHAIGWLLKPKADDREISRLAFERGVETPPLSAYCQQVTLPPALLLGFASVRPREMAPAVRVLARILGT